MSTETVTAGWANPNVLSTGFPVLMRGARVDLRADLRILRQAVHIVLGEAGGTEIARAQLAVRIGGGAGDARAHAAHLYVAAANVKAPEVVETAVRGATPVSSLDEIPKAPSHEDVTAAYDQCIDELHHQAETR